jgi:AcrR family transcriptional regulator
MASGTMVKATSARARRALPAKADRPEFPLSYGEFLDARLDDPTKRKGERTRDRLKAATVNMLEKSGYRDLRVTDINETAKVSNALFYVYFQNKEEIAKEVLTDFLSYLDTFRSRDPPHTSSEESIYYGNLRYAEMFRANPGLMRCIFQFTDEFPEFAQHWHAWNRSWRDRVIRSLARARGVQFKSQEDVGLAVVALGSMIDGFLRLAFIEGEPSITAPETPADTAALALFLTRMWIRSLFAREMTWSPPN